MPELQIEEVEQVSALKYINIVHCDGTFCLVNYAYALSLLHRYDGMVIKAHPIYAAIIAEIIREQPFKLPIVSDRRNRADEVEIVDVASMGVAVVRFEGLATPLCVDDPRNVGQP